MEDRVVLNILYLVLLYFFVNKKLVKVLMFNILLLGFFMFFNMMDNVIDVFFEGF